MKFTGERYVPELTGSIEFEHMNRYYFVINQIDLKNKVVLDIASGEGYGSELLAKHAKYVYGVDISKESISHSSLKYKRDNLIFIEGDAVSIPLNDGVVDVVVSFETIEHHDRHEEMLSEIKRVLKKKGMLIMSSPDKQFFFDKGKNDFHIKELYYDEFKELISKYFKKTFLYSQTIFDGSLIALDENNEQYKKPIIVNKQGDSNYILPIYNVGIGTDDLDFYPEQQIVLYNDTKLLSSTNSEIELAVQAVRNTKAFRLGKFILKPLSFIREKLIKL